MKTTTNAAANVIQLHIIDHLDLDHDAPLDVVQNALEGVIPSKHRIYPTDYHRVYAGVEGTSFDFVTVAIIDFFVNELGFDRARCERKDDLDTFKTYAHLIAREGANLLAGKDKRECMRPVKTSRPRFMVVSPRGFANELRLELYDKQKFEDYNNDVNSWAHRATVAEINKYRAALDHYQLFVLNRSKPYHYTADDIANLLTECAEYNTDIYLTFSN